MAASALDTRKTPTEGSKDNEVRNEWFENPNSFVFSAIFLFKILAGIVSLSGGGAVATAHRFRYKTKKMKRDMDLEEITEPSLKIRRYFWNFFANVAPFVCMVIENGKIPPYPLHNATARQATPLDVANAGLPMPDFRVILSTFLFHA